MSADWKSDIGQQLYEALLPQVYRNRDNNSFDGNNKVTELGDLAKYLDACGELLDQVRHTLNQRLYDNFPDNGEDGSCQEWLVPYFAQLVDASLLSPEAEGRRDEVAKAVSWRQSKGTLHCVEDIAESVGQMEAEIQEGWKRVAHTPRIGMPLLPAAAFGEDEPDTTHPIEAITHPALPTVAVDLRKPSRAVLSETGRADERRTRFLGAELSWRQLNPRGLPCFRDSFEDTSPRTVDVRTPNWQHGHYHPKRLLLHVPVPAGFFSPDQYTLQWNDDLITTPLLEVADEDGVRVYRGRTERPLCISGSILLTGEGMYRFENVLLVNKLTVSFGYLELRDAVAANVEVKTVNHKKPVLAASDCLLGKLTIATGLSTLDCCTVLDKAVCLHLQAENSIFNSTLQYDSAIDAPPLSGKIRHCRIPATIAEATAPEELDVNDDDITHDTPDFFADALGFVGATGKKVLKENGVAVLAPACPASIVTGASDGGEMGFYHQGRQRIPVRIIGNQTLKFPTDSEFLLCDLVFLGNVSISVDTATAYLERIAAKSLHVPTAAMSDATGAPQPVLDARNSLFDTLTVDKGLALLEYCTVMVAATFKTIQASDCLFAGSLNPGNGGCVRYSRLPGNLSAVALEKIQVRKKLDTNTRDVPVFFELWHCDESKPRLPVFGKAAYGVLHPATSAKVRFGAEERGEMGAYHHKHCCLRADALIEKLADYMPVNLEPVIIFDERLNHTPPAMKVGDS